MAAGAPVNLPSDLLRVGLGVPGRTIDARYTEHAASAVGVIVGAVQTAPGVRTLARWFDSPPSALGVLQGVLD